MRVMSNVPALQSYNALNSTNSALSKSIQRLSTGLRINSAADDAAGLAISEKMRAQIRGLDQATANAQDGISMIQTAEGALSETHSILQRMRELSVQAANDTLTQEDRSYIQLEIDQLKEEITRISTTTQFNKKKLLDGSAAVLWSADNLETKALVRGGLRQIDQFGQKVAVEGNFKIEIEAEPGQAQIQKTDIFKVKHENVVMNLQIDKNAGFEKLEINNMPAGSYSVKQGVAVTGGKDNKYTAYKMATTTPTVGNLNVTAAAFTANGTTVALTFSAVTEAVYIGGKLVKAGEDYRINVTISAGVTGTAVAVAAALAKLDIKQATATVVQSYYASGNLMYQSFYGLSAGNISFKASSIGNADNLNASILFEVVNVDTTNSAVTFRVQVNALGTDGTQYAYSDNNFMVTNEGVAVGSSDLGFYFIKADAFKIDNIAGIDKGDKMVLTLRASNTSAATNTITISGTVNTTWEWAWNASTGGGANLGVSYNVDADSLAKKDVHFKNFYLNTANGTVYEGDVKISFNDKMKAVATGTATRASFEAAYVGQVAKGDVKLRDLDKFWDANGKFMLDDPQEITIVQGDGKKASINLYSTDTLEEVRQKLNDAVAYGLGQAKYAVEYADNFVSFVDKSDPNTPDAVEGTFVIRSLIPGANGELNFSGDEDIIKAFSLNTIQASKENTFRVTVSDAHSGMMLSSNQKVTGNVLYGIVNPNIDVEFDAMANVTVAWNEQTKSFDLKRDAGIYSTILHLADNTTVFQIGANEGEDMGIDIGDMSAHALGVDRVLVTDRESAARSITIIDSAINRVSKQRAMLGAYQNRLEHTINNLTTASTNTTAAESRIRDADMAKEMMNFTKLNILSQAGNSMLAQANQLPQNVLSLLR